MINILINNGDGLNDVDYTKYVVSSSIQITKGINIPTTCSLSLQSSDSTFKMPVPRAYVKIYSTLNKKFLFTGLLVTDPATSFIGLSKAVSQTDNQIYQYDLNCTSDEYLLNIKSLDFRPAFANQTQGQILKNMAEALAPGFFDYTYIADGDLVPYMQYDPKQSWSEVAKKLGDASRYRYSCVNRQIHFQPYGDGELGITYDETLGEGTFDPKGFQSTPMTTQIVNDITVIGAEEAGNSREDFFIGDGFSGAFPLRHKVFGLGTNFQGSSVLLLDKWNNNSLNTQNWLEQDPAAQFSFENGALNILSGFQVQPGVSYIQANNAIELAGGIVIQHGEVIFDDESIGIIGGLYSDSTLNVASALGGFGISNGPTVTVTASGAAGIQISPYQFGLTLSGAFQVLTQVNKSYTLYTRVSAPLPVRYYQTFRSLAGSVFGGYTTSPNVTGSITWSVLETDLFSEQINQWTYTVSGALIPDTAVYGLINNQKLNITLNSTQVWSPPPGALKVQGEIGAGALSPIFISGNVQYTGAFVTPSGGNLPILPAAFGPEQQFDLGSGIGSQAAEVDTGTQADTLNFYSNDLPGVGTRIRLQTWESQTAVSRMQNPTSIALEATVVGDDGHRHATVTDLSPLPRTSVDCDNAGAAFLTDKSGVFYQGTYACSWYFFSQFTNDIDFYPACGRYLFVNAPNRNIVRQNLLVTGITMTIEELAGERVNYSISFGPDLYVEKVLSAIVSIPTNVLEPIDTAIQPTPQALSQLGSFYLPDVFQTTVQGFISGAQFTVNFNDKLVASSGAIYEVRTGDLNWGQNDGYLLFRLGVNQPIILSRTQYDQSWYIRQVCNLGTSGFASSRRTKVLRIVYPRIPSAPVLQTGDTGFVQMDYSGDIRNIEGLELRQADDKTVCYQTIVGSRFDMGIDMDLLRNQLLPGQQGLTGLGQFLTQPFSASSRLLNAHFFNLMWEYSPALSIAMPPPNAPSIIPGYRWGSQVLIRVKTNALDANRTDLKTTHAQLSADNIFSISGMQQDIAVDGNPGFVTTTVPVTGSLYIRAQYIDHVGSGAWSNVLFIPRGDLIASDYLGGQGSVPPVVIANPSASGGGIFSYFSASGGTVLDLFSQTFSIWFPNNAIVNVPASSGVFTAPLDVTGGLQPLTLYGFFPSLKAPLTPAEFISFNGPYLNYGGTLTLPALTGLFQDGSVPLTNGAFVVQTSSATGTGGGGGGGSYGGGGNQGCGILSSKVKMADGSLLALKDLSTKVAIKTPNGVGFVDKITLMKEPIVTFVVESGLTGKASTSHTLFCGNRWVSLADLICLLEDDEDVFVWTENNLYDRLIYISQIGEKDWVSKIHLSGSIDKEDVEHYYSLDGFLAHNVKIGSFQ